VIKLVAAFAENRLVGEHARALYCQLEGLPDPDPERL
jgi:hypothetical protein